MKESPYQHLPPLEHRPGGSPYRMTPAQRKRASGLIRRECCNCDGGNCLALDDGDTCACPQMVTFSVCGAAFVPHSNRAKYCDTCKQRVHRQQKNASDRKRRWKMDK